MKLVEVGRADGWSISTLAIKPVRSDFVDVTVFEGFVQRLLQNLVNNNGHWDREFFKKESRYVFDIAKHMSDQLIVRWAERIFEKVI